MESIGGGEVEVNKHAFEGRKHAVYAYTCMYIEDALRI